MVLPTRLMVFSISAVALAGLLFVATHDGDEPDRVTPAASAPKTPTVTDPEQAPQVRVTPSAPATTPPSPVLKNKQFVVVFNNSNVKGLAGKTAGRATAAGWNVVGSDNWYGTVDTSTVYFGPGKKDAAQLLAKDLNIASVKPAVNPMRADRLTVILTADYAAG